MVQLVRKTGSGWVGFEGEPTRASERERERGVCVLSAERERERETAQICRGILG